MESRGVVFDSALIKGKKRTKPKKLIAYIKFFTRIYTLALFKKYDVVYVHYIAHSLLPFIAILPFKKFNLVVNAHGEDLLPRSTLERLILKANRRCIEHSSLIVVPSSFFASIAKELYPHNEVFISPSGGIDLNIFKPHDKKCTVAIHRKITLGYVSRIDQSKGWDTLLHALCDLKKRLPSQELEVIFVGSGEQTNEFKSTVSALGLDDTVHYRGALNQEELPQLYADLDAFIFPTRLKESLGLVGLEALACGTPAICSSIGGITTYMQDGVNGFTFLPGDHLDLSRKIEALIKLPPEKMREMRESALRTASKYCRDKVADQLLHKLNEVTEHGN